MSTVPILRSFDERKMREFYVDFLGFTVEWDHRFADDLPLYAQLRRGDCVLHLTEHHGDCSPGAKIRIQIEDVTDYQKALAARKYGNARPGLETPPWGGKEMTVTDPFLNTLVFWTPDPA